jgi:hypothetical protein
MSLNNENDKEIINYEEILKRIQITCRNLEFYLREIKNREMDLAIINLQQAAHWAYHAIGRAETEKRMENKDG